MAWLVRLFLLFGLLFVLFAWVWVVCLVDVLLMLVWMVVGFMVAFGRCLRFFVCFVVFGVRWCCRVWLLVFVALMWCSLLRVCVVVLVDCVVASGWVLFVLWFALWLLLGVLFVFVG